MGDKANLVVETDPGQRVFFYTHCSGYNLPATVQRGLSKNWRWDDPPYLARILFCEMIKGHEETEMGFGISTHICDNEHPLLLVRPLEQVIEMHAVSAESWEIVGDWKTPLNSWSFKKFCDLKNISWDILEASA